MFLYLDIDYDTWMLSGSAVMKVINDGLIDWFIDWLIFWMIIKDGNTVKNNYGCDLDSLNIGYRLGMLRTSEGKFFLIIIL